MDTGTLWTLKSLKNKMKKYEVRKINKNEICSSVGTGGHHNGSIKLRTSAGLRKAGHRAAVFLVLIINKSR